MGGIPTGGRLLAEINRTPIDGFAAAISRARSILLSPASSVCEISRSIPRPIYRAWSNNLVRTRRFDHECMGGEISEQCK